jgi:hypothetical protein
MEVDLEIEDDENDIDYNSDFENEFDKDNAKNNYESDSENEDNWPVRDNLIHYVNVRNTMQKNVKIFFFFQVRASDSASGHMAVNNIIEKELFSHDSLDAARDFWPSH